MSFCAIRNSFKKFIYLSKRSCSTLPKYSQNCFEERDPAPYFFDERVQKILYLLIGKDLNEILKHIYASPKSNLQFASDDKIEEFTDIANKKAKYRLQVPPAIKPLKEDVRILAKNPELQGFSRSKFVIADISEELTDRNRPVYVRETDGTLRTGTIDEKYRMNLIYNPRPKRHFKEPLMFTDDEHFRTALDNRMYKDLLDMACLYYEPHHRIFHKISHQTFNHINSKEDYEIIFNTRHFGSLAFYLSWIDDVEGLLVHLLNNNRFDRASSLLKLYSIVQNFDFEYTFVDTPDMSEHLGIFKEGYTSIKYKNENRIKMAIKNAEERIMLLNAEENVDPSDEESIEIDDEEILFSPLAEEVEEDISGKISDDKPNDDDTKS